MSGANVAELEKKRKRSELFQSSFEKKLVGDCAATAKPESIKTIQKPKTAKPPINKFR